MKYKTFKNIIKTIVEIHDINFEKERKIQEAFGGDSQIMTNETGLFMDKLIKALALDFVEDENSKEFEEAVDWIDYLVYENLLDDNYDPKKDSIFITNKGHKKAYPANEKVIWNILRKKI